MLLGIGDGDSSTDASGRQLTFDPITVTGTPPPSALRSAMPWLIAAGVIGAVWWFAYDSRRRRRARPHGGRPFVG